MSSSALAAGLRHLRGKLAAQQHNDDNDEHLLHAFLTRRDESAFAVLVRRYGPMVLHVCRRVLAHEQDAEDAFQATFVVLARRAAKLRKKASLSSFLHGIAYRIALKAKRAAARRRKYEGKSPPRPNDEPSTALLWDEVRMLLDNEITRLPEKYRSAFVLHYLEDCSREETARRLGLKEGTVASRLAEARRRLSLRLAHRGVELTAVLAASTLATPEASALSPVLAVSTIKAALAMAAGETLSGVVAASVAELVQGMTTAMMLSKAKLASVVLVVGLLTAATSGALVKWYGSASETLAATPEPSAPADDDKAAPPQRETTESVQIQGRVLGPDGAAKAGAKLLLAGEDEKIAQLGVTAADGRFTVAVPKEPKYKRLFRYLIAQTDGAGIDFLDLRSLVAGKPVKLRLVKDNVVRGRVVNTEGKPVAGVQVVAETINTHIGNSLDSFLAAYIKTLAGGAGSATQKVLWHGGKSLFTDTTDAGGRFALHGIGAERTFSLLFHGGIADTTLLYVVNRAGFDPEPYNRQFRDYFALANGRRDQRWIPAHLLYGPDISLVAESEKIIRGKVTDADTGKGQAGLSVWLAGYWDNMNLPSSLKAKTDAEGRYAIHGARKAKRYLVQSASDAVSGYTPRQVWADDTTAYQPVVVDLKVKKGVIVTGKVIDGATGEAIPGWAKAAILADNPFIKDYHYDKFSTPNGMPLDARSREMDADGTFRLVTLPGPVLLMGGPDHQKMSALDALKYCPPITDPKYPKFFQVRPGPFIGETSLSYLGLKGFRGGVDGNFCTVLDIKPGVARVKQDIILQRASVKTVTIQDAEGRSLRGVWVTGISPRMRYGAFHLDSDSCPVYHVEAGKSRLMVFCAPQRKLAGTSTLKGDEKSPIVVKLGQTGSIKGRLLDADGKPLAGIEVDLRYRDSQAQGIERAIHDGKQIVTDADGAFLLDTLIPEMKFELKFRRGRRPFERATKAAEEALQVYSGACRDLGAIKLRLVADKPRR